MDHVSTLRNSASDQSAGVNDQIFEIIESVTVQPSPWFPVCVHFLLGGFLDRTFP